ncbi:MAG: type III-B CRISPR module RAMP protein Cmr4 [Candidatus Viridilinea halotolerans]|uniref:Type III-B CRISPR module RAMP protein Cmr4 n=1 Tax=Candidatus Viridilinea halotolerans TaxID=2491704 RepID=A0A426TYJ1_9CHLR|nr:MAG: type III-B CRISPR module RAMP protein Cmr4 [Candidatus Viridilinea halotolerans]
MANARLYFIHALAPLHPGTGQGTGVIDLPIAREKATGIPYLPGSSVKGSLRDSGLVSDTKRFFGPDVTAADEHAGAAQFADARLLLLPMRSLRGTFAWVTSPYLLRRASRDAAGLQADLPADIPTPGNHQQALLSGTALRYQNKQVILEDLDLVGSASREAQAWATWIGKHAFAEEPERQLLNERLCVVHDDVLSFLLTTATEVFARIRLQPDQKTVAEGALWYEEALPAETLLVGLILAQKIGSYTPSDVFTELKKLNGRSFQFGGKATVGRGICRLQVAGGGQ